MSHADALRRIGVELTGVVGSTPERAASKRIAPTYPSYEDLLDDHRVDVVHVTTPNHLHYAQVKLALEARKHVVCEKPLAMTSAESAELVELANATGLVHCTNFNVRFYPLLQEARERIRRGELGQIWNVHGAYLQDWLATPADWNWRLEPEKGGELRAVGDIGSHWLDLAQFLTGQTVVEVLADLATVIPVRRRPEGDVETYGTAGESKRVDVAMSTEDIAHILLRFAGGARGSCVFSQVSFGRKSALRIEADGSRGAVAWDGELHDRLWLGRRDRGNELLQRHPTLMGTAAVPRAHMPGSAEGHTDTFRELYRTVYADVAAGGPSSTPDYPTFLDGHRGNELVDAIARSNQERRWVVLPSASAARPTTPSSCP